MAPRPTWLPVYLQLHASCSFPGMFAIGEQGDELQVEEEDKIRFHGDFFSDSATMHFGGCKDYSRTNCLATAVSTNKKGEITALGNQGTQQQRPGNSAWHASKYRVHKLNQRYILIRCSPDRQNFHLWLELFFKHDIIYFGAVGSKLFPTIYRLFKIDHLSALLLHCFPFFFFRGGCLFICLFLFAYFLSQLWYIAPQ